MRDEDATTLSPDRQLRSPLAVRSSSLVDVEQIRQDLCLDGLTQERIRVGIDVFTEKMAKQSCLVDILVRN